MAQDTTATSNGLQPAANGSTLKRQSATTPDSEPASKKTRTARNSSLEGSTELAFQHLLVDDPSHPLYQRNADQVVQHAVTNDELKDAITNPFLRTLDQATSKNDKLSTKKIQEVQQTLAIAFTERVLAQVGVCLDRSFGLGDCKEKLSVHHEADGYRIDLSVKPVLHVKEDEGQAVSGGKQRTEEKAKKTVTNTQNGVRPVNQNNARPANNNARPANSNAQPASSTARSNAPPVNQNALPVRDSRQDESDSSSDSRTSDEDSSDDEEQDGVHPILDTTMEIVNPPQGDFVESSSDESEDSTDDEGDHGEAEHQANDQLRYSSDSNSASNSDSD